MTQLGCFYLVLNFWGVDNEQVVQYATAMEGLVKTARKVFEVGLKLIPESTTKKSTVPSVFIIRPTVICPVRYTT